MKTTLEYAEFYVNECGFSVIPLKEHEKIPAVKWKEYQSRKPTDKELKKWFGNGSKFNIAIVTGRISNLTVVDVDNDAGMEFAKNNCTLTPAVRTGSGKYHFYYQYKEGSRNYQKRSDLDGIDLKSEGGTITAPPSIHPKTLKQYEWSQQEMLGKIPTVELPSVFIGVNGKMFTKTEEGKISQGQRDEFLTSQAGAMRARGMSEQAIFSALMIENYQKCEPPLAEKQVKKIAKSVQRYKPKTEPKPNKEEIASPYFDKKAFIPLYLAKEIMEGHTFINCNQELYVYNNGVYLPEADEFIKRKCRQILGKEARINRINEVVCHIKDMTYTKGDSLNNEKSLINVKNGMLDWKSRKLLPHSPEYLSSIQIPVTHDIEAVCPMIDSFLETTLPIDCVSVVKQMFGYCLLPDTRFEKAFMLTGTGANGKSTFLHLLEKFIGFRNISKVPLQDFDEHRFKRAEIFGKLVNLFADLDSRALKSSSYFKTIVSGDSIDAEEKHKKPFFFKPFSRLIFSANEIPHSYDKSFAYFRRWIILPFPNTFTGTDANKDLSSRITCEYELSGFLNKAISALGYLYEKQGFLETKTTQDSLKEYRTQNDSTASFVDECCVIDPDRRCLRTSLYSEYSTYCKENGYRQISSTRFYKDIKSVENIYENKSNGKRFLNGISLLEIE